MNIVLIGDSIFDNASYVGEGESVSDIIKSMLPDSEVSLLAVDGDITLDVHEQIKSFPATATEVFLSCGGNDALRNIHLLDIKSGSVGESLSILYQAKEAFRSNYVAMLNAVLRNHGKVCVLTIYNKVPGLSESACTALALFNEIILEEVTARNLPTIDLRVICNEEQDYSKVSPIEPSVYGGKKIVERMLAVIDKRFYSSFYV